MVSVQNLENRNGHMDPEDRDIRAEDLLDTDPAIQMPDSSSDDEKLKRLHVDIKRKKESIEAIKRSLADYAKKQLEKKGKITETPDQIDMRNTIAAQKLKLKSMADGEEKEGQKNFVDLLEQAYTRVFGEDKSKQDEESASGEKDREYLANVLKQKLEINENELKELEDQYNQLDFEIGNTGANA